MRQIETFIRVLAKVLLGKEQDDIYSFELIDETRSDSDPLMIKLDEMIKSGDICGAEDMLFEELERGDIRTVETALRFYRTLSEMSDDELEEKGFSREEISQGIKDVGGQFGVML